MADDDYGGGLLGRIREWLDALPLVTPQIVSDAQESVPRHPDDVRSPARRFEVRDSYIEIEAGSQDGARLATQYPMSISEVLTIPVRHRRGPLPPVPDTAAQAAFARAQAEIAIQVYARLGISSEEFQETLAAISRIMGETYESPARQITPEARERARALLRGLLTDGERRVFEECGYVPVIGPKSGDLWLVTGKPVYNLVRYERIPRGARAPAGAYPGKAAPVTWCAAAAAYAPVEDLTSSLLIALRSAEPRVIEVANRLPFQPTGWASGWPRHLLRCLALDRCRNERQVTELIEADARLPSHREFTSIDELTGNISFR